MKKKLSNQIILLFFLVIIICIGIFAAISSVRFDNMYAEICVDNLKEYVALSEDSWGSGNSPREIGKYGFIYGNKDNVFNSINANDYLNNDQLKLLKNEIFKKHNNDYSILTIEIDNQMIISVGKINSDGNFMIAFSDNRDMTHYRNNSFLLELLIFGSIIVWATTIVAIWSQQIVSRLRKIQKDVINLPQTQYKNEIVYNGEDEIADLAKSIENMRQEICRNEDIKREIIQNVSHDFKTPIAVIKSYAEAIYDGIETKEAAEVIIKQSEILKNKTVQLLEYNKLEYIDKNKEFEEVNMKEMINNIIDNYRFQTDIEFVLDLENVYFKGFNENFRTVILNILDNGIRYAKHLIKITLQENRLEIYNDGENIDKELLNKIFKPYEKGNKGQFGLGMSIVKRTLDFFNYRIDIINHEVGVSFIISK